jgi:HEAT repeat protein
VEGPVKKSTAPWARNSPVNASLLLAGCLAGAVPEADRAFVAAVEEAVRPAPVEIRVTAVEDLGLLGDARALSLLRRLLHAERNTAVQRAAVRALRSLGTAEAVQVLDEALRVQLPLEVSTELVLALPYLRWARAREALAWAAGADGPPALREVARLSLSRFDSPPALLEESP